MATKARMPKKAKREVNLDFTHPFLAKLSQEVMCWTYGNPHMKEECPTKGKKLDQNLHFQVLNNVNIIKLKVMTLNIVVYCIQNIIPTNLSTYTTTNHGLFDWKTK
jgi:hypothetical protein